MLRKSPEVYQPPEDTLLDSSYQEIMGELALFAAFEDYETFEDFRPYIETSLRIIKPSYQPSLETISRAETVFIGRSSKHADVLPEDRRKSNGAALILSQWQLLNHLAAFVPSDDENTFDELFSWTERALQTLNPDYAVTDDEKAVMEESFLLRTQKNGRMVLSACQTGNQPYILDPAYQKKINSYRSGPGVGSIKESEKSRIPL
jgi:hypothetical protein